MHRWQRLARALGALAFLTTICSFAGQSAYADASLAAIGMGHGSPSHAYLANFQAVINKYNASGERFRIDTHCPSACTMFLSIRNVCITPGATLAFHSGGNMNGNKSKNGTDWGASDTQLMLSTYNAALRQYVTDNHFMDTFAFHTISGSEMVKRFGYPACR